MVALVVAVVAVVAVVVAVMVVVVVTMMTVDSDQSERKYEIKHKRDEPVINKAKEKAKVKMETTHTTKPTNASIPGKATPKKAIKLVKGQLTLFNMGGLQRNKTPNDNETKVTSAVASNKEDPRGARGRKVSDAKKQGSSRKAIGGKVRIGTDSSGRNSSGGGNGDKRCVREKKEEKSNSESKGLDKKSNPVDGDGDGDGDDVQGSMNEHAQKAVGRFVVHHKEFEQQFAPVRLDHEGSALHFVPCSISFSRVPPSLISLAVSVSLSLSGSLSQSVSPSQSLSVSSQSFSVSLGLSQSLSVSLGLSSLPLLLSLDLDPRSWSLFSPSLDLGLGLSLSRSRSRSVSVSLCISLPSLASIVTVPHLAIITTDTISILD